MTKRPILTITVIFVILFLGIYFVWLPKYQNINNLRVLAKERRNELEAKRKYFSELEVIANKLKNYSQGLAKIESALPLFPGIPDALNFLEGASLENGLILQEVGLDRTSPLIRQGQETDIKKTGIRILVDGSYEAFKSFLAQVQSNARLIEVDKLSFDFPLAGQTFDFDLMLRIHSY